jgi:RNA recognition motif-containing protein
MDHQSTQGLLSSHIASTTPTSSSPMRLFVGGLVPEVTESQLYNYFRKFGVLTECDIPKTIRGKKKKFGYISFSQEIDAQTVLQSENHYILGSPIQVELALSTLDIFHEQLRKSKCKLFVSGDLIAGSDAAIIYKEISTFGVVEKVKKLRTDKKSFNSCFVTMKSIADAEYLLEQKSLVLPTLMKVTFKRFVPRGRGEDQDLEDDGESSSPIQKVHCQLNYQVQDKLDTTNLLTQVAQNANSIEQKVIFLRQGLSITLSPANSWTADSQQYHCPPQKKINKAQLISLEFIDIQSIQNFESNLRYNVAARIASTTYKGIVFNQ